MIELNELINKLLQNYIKRGKHDTCCYNRIWSNQSYWCRYPKPFRVIKKGSHGLTKIDRFDPLTKGCKTTFCAAIPSDFDPAEHSPFKEMEKKRTY